MVFLLLISLVLMDFFFELTVLVGDALRLLVGDPFLLFVGDAFLLFMGDLDVDLDFFDDLDRSVFFLSPTVPSE